MTATAGKTPIPPRAASALELFLFLGGLPLLAVIWPDYTFRRVLLLTACAYVALRLYGRVDWRHVGGLPSAGWWRAPALRGALVAVCILAYVLIVEPDRLFALPRERPGVWLAIMFAYPIFSVIPQELIYRVYLFETHAGLWIKPRLAIIASALLFGWMHIVFVGWFAVATTTIGGFLLADTYARTRAKPGALWIVALEHSLYGLAMFTMGLGKYFFMPR